MNNFKDFANKMDETADKVGIRVSQVHRAVALTVVDDLVKNTPVLTGRARSNWQANLSKPNNSIADAKSEEEAIGEAGDNIGKHIPGQDIYITNNLKYIGLLNDGSSKKQPALFVERAIKRGEATKSDIKL